MARQGRFTSNVYSRKGSSNRRMCPSHCRSGCTSSLWLKRSESSILDDIFVSNWLVMLPLLLPVKNVGTPVPLKLHVGPNGNMWSTPLLCSSFMSSISSSNNFMSSLITSSSSFDNGFNSSTSVTFNLDDAIIIAHMTALPSTAVKPKTVKWLSLKELRTWERMSFATINFCPSALPSPFCDMFSPTSSKNTGFSGCKSEQLVCLPYASVLQYYCICLATSHNLTFLPPLLRPIFYILHHTCLQNFPTCANHLSYCQN
jgi:hypothetical protein